jgi:phosphatidate cytidylyltransferase
VSGPAPAPRPVSSGASPLVRRVLTAGILVPLVLAALWLLPTPAVALVFGLILVAGAHEWAILAGLASRRLAWAAAATLGLTLALLWPAIAEPPAWLALGIAWWCLALAWVVRYQTGRPIAGFDSTAVRLIGGWLTLVPTWIAMVWLHGAVGPAAVLGLLLIIWGADIGAYFAGRRFGRHRLASRVSPGKSREGVAGGLLAALLVALGLHAAGHAPLPLAAFLAFSVFIAGVSVLGDLSESLLKRVAQVKDSGGLLPGHGGILDRIDSLTAAAPFYAYGLLVAGAGR